jgi:predicted flap endonuclease-1-like 5' DNA nuclease
MIDESLGAFRGRLERDRVLEQADFLARGDIAGYEAKFGKL